MRNRNVCRGRCPSSALRAALRAAAPRNQPAGVASTRTGHIQFHETLQQICHCPTGGQGRPPLQNLFRFCRWFVQFCDCILPGGVEPLPYAAGGNFTDSHWRGPICRCVPHNPFVTASPCHLPLHKGGFGAAQTQQHLKTYHPSPHQSAVQKAPPGGRGFFYCSVCRASSMRVMSTSAV